MEALHTYSIMSVHKTDIKKHATETTKKKTVLVNKLSVNCLDFDSPNL